MLAIGPKFHGLKPGRGDGFLRAIKSASRFPSEGSKAVGPMLQDLRHVKISMYGLRYFEGQIHFLRQDFPALLLDDCY
jgi:hypothetical protein